MAITGAEVREQALRRRFERSRIPARYRGMSLELLDRTDTNGVAIDSVQRWLDDLKNNPKGGVGLLLYGPPGRGKTTLACCAGQWVLNHGGPCYYTPVARWQKTMLRTFREHEDNDGLAEAYRTLDVIENIFCVIMDDVGKEHTTQSGHIEDELDALFRLRYDNGTPTIVTSNVPPPEWKTRYSSAMESFLHEAFVVVGVGGPDWRKRSRGEG